MDLFGAARPRDEEQNFEDLATARHGEDVCHPCPDPFEVLRRLDDPDKSQTASGAGAVGVSGNKLAYLRNLMCDANTRSPKHDGTVRSEVFATCDMTFVSMDRAFVV